MQNKCINCSAPFEITEDELNFYAEISPSFGSERFLIPSPEMCPNCRSQARCIHRNQRSLYKRNCDLCNKSIIAMYDENAPFPVYCQECFFGDKWDALAYGQDFDEQRSFFEQFGELLNKVPHLCIMNSNSQNSDYCNYSYANKNCYLTNGSAYEEDCLYDAYSMKNNFIVDCLWDYDSELLYECSFSKKCYNCLYLDYCDNCTDCHFSRDLKGCKNCTFCANLHQKEYCMFNEQLTKEEYEQKLSALALHTYSGLEAARKQYLSNVISKFPVRALQQVQCEDCVGSTLNNCKNMQHCFFATNCEDCRYTCQQDEVYNSMDIDYMGYDRAERCYQTLGCSGIFDCIGVIASWNCSNLLYTQFSFGSNNCFGSASLDHKEYCILNKQYSKEEYEQLVPKIITQMQSTKDWGIFFPRELSPFAYNETIVMDWFPLTEKEAETKGYTWKKEEDAVTAEKIIPAEKLPETIEEVPDDVLNWAITCQVSGRPFRMVKQELDFYRKMNLPVPHLHPEERHKLRIERRHGRQIWKRSCDQCSQDIETTYDPKRPEKVLCEECYLKEVY